MRQRQGEEEKHPDCEQHMSFTVCSTCPSLCVNADLLNHRHCDVEVRSVLYQKNSTNIITGTAGWLTGGIPTSSLGLLLMHASESLSDLPNFCLWYWPL